jgi:hypothetical protein
MKTKTRIFVSVPDDRHLDTRRRSLKKTIIKFIAKQGFDVTGFEPEQYGADLPVNRESWTVDRAKDRIRKCDGVLILALARLHVRVFRSEDDINTNGVGFISTLPTPYNHLEGALALAQGLPVLILSKRPWIVLEFLTAASRPLPFPQMHAPNGQDPNHLKRISLRGLSRFEIVVMYFWGTAARPIPPQEEFANTWKAKATLF